MPTIKSIVLTCAGFGSRLGLAQTKALINIGKRTLINWQLDLLQEIEDVRIVIGYQAENVIREVLKVRKDAIFVYNHDYLNTKTGASFYAGAKDANEYVIEWDGDLLVHPDDVKLILRTEGEFACYSDISSDEAVYVKTNNNGDVISFSRENGDYEWTGPVCIKKSKLRYTPGNVFEQIDPHLPMKGLKVRAYDIDTYEDYKRVAKFIKSW